MTLPSQNHFEVTRRHDGKYMPLGSTPSGVFSYYSTWDRWAAADAASVEELCTRLNEAYRQGWRDKEQDVKTALGIKE
jgi:hypothetical protein